MSSEAKEPSPQPSGCGIIASDGVMVFAVCVSCYTKRKSIPFVNKGFLRPERPQDHAAIQSAINGFICHSLAPAEGEQG
jgi:hypothetical protein